MKDEILDKVYSTDETPIPRYQIVDRDGNVVLSGVEIRLLNLISQLGTPYNTESILPDSVASKICPEIPNPNPADAFAGLLPLRGGTMTGAIAMGGNKITGLGDPAADGDALPKGYVIPAAEGGTGRATLTANAILAGNTTSAVKQIATASGALYATAANGAAKFGTLPIAQGGTGATDRLAAAKNLTNEAVSSPNYVVSLTNSWGKFGYTTMAQLMTALGAASATPSFSSVKTDAYHNFYFTKIGKLVICTLVLKSLGTNVYGENITVPTGYRPSTAQSFTIYSDTAHWQASGSNVSNGGSIAVKVATGGKLSINEGGGYNYNTNEMNITLCWATS